MKSSYDEINVDLKEASNTAETGEDMTKAILPEEEEMEEAEFIPEGIENHAQRRPS